MPEIFVPHPEGVKEILRGGEAVSAMLDATKHISDQVLANVPVRTGALLKQYTEHMVTSVQIDPDTETAAGYVGTTLGISGIIEFGTAQRPGGYHPFGLAALQCGLKYEPKGAP